MSEPNFNAFSLLAYLLFQFRVPVKLFFLNSRRFYLNKCCELKQRFLHVWHDTAPIIWNSLPLHLRSFTISREQFRALSAPTWLTSENYWGVKLLTYLLTYNAIDEWRGRLCACVRAKDGHLEQLLWQNSATWQYTFQFFFKCDTNFRWFFGNYHKFELLNFTR